MKAVFFDHETTGLPLIQTAEVTVPDNWPRTIQTAYLVQDLESGECMSRCAILRPDGFTIPEDTVQYHGISQERALLEGMDREAFFTQLLEDTRDASVWVAHNGLRFDMPILQAELRRLGLPCVNRPVIDTMLETVMLTRIPVTTENAAPDTFKWPSLNQLSAFLNVAGRQGPDATRDHDALEDVRILQSCFHRLIATDWFQIADNRITTRQPPATASRQLRKYLALARSGELLSTPEPIDPTALCSTDPESGDSPLQVLVASQSDPATTILSWIASGPIGTPRHTPAAILRIREILRQHLLTLLPT